VVGFSLAVNNSKQHILSHAKLWIPLRNFASRGNYTEMSEKRPPFSFWRGLQHAWSNCLGVANNFSASAGALVLTIVSVVTGWKMPTPDGALGLLLGWVLSAAAIWIIIFVGG
jgi:hypothetical protein